MIRLVRILIILSGLFVAIWVMANPSLDGYLNAHFNMTAAQVRPILNQDGVTVTSDETTNGDHLIFGQRKRNWITTELLYVFPAGTDRLALVIEVFPGLLDSFPVRKELIQQFGQPSAENFPEAILRRMQETNTIPAGVTQMTVWNMIEDGKDREARLMMLNEYVRVEYIDNNLMAGNQ